jgi:hypothetical protein
MSQGSEKSPFVEQINGNFGPVSHVELQRQMGVTLMESSRNLIKNVVMAQCALCCLATFIYLFIYLFIYCLRNFYTLADITGRSDQERVIQGMYEGVSESFRTESITK